MDFWQGAMQDALDSESLLRLSELDVHMIVHAKGGDHDHRVIEVLISPDGFWDMGIVRTIDLKTGYDHTWLYQVNGKNDNPIWSLLGWHQTPIHR